MTIQHQMTVLCALLISACASNQHTNIEPEPDPVFLSIATNPEDFDGKVMTIRGWISLRFEDRNLWATKKDHEEWETRRCISLVNYSVLKEIESTLDKRYVEVTGILRSDATEGGTLIRMASCRKVGIEVSGTSSVRVIDGL